jgi:hypothetical protein
MSGFKSKSQWSQCERNNGTHLDCPIGDPKNGKEKVMYVAVHNPSNLKMK